MNTRSMKIGLLERARKNAESHAAHAKTMLELGTLSEESKIAYYHMFSWESKQKEVLEKILEMEKVV